MTLERIRFESREQWLQLRQQDITASQIGALFGAHSFVTAYEVWATKTGRLKTDREETPAMMRGRLLERVAVELLRERHPDWDILHNAAGGFYYRDTDARMGATPDAIVTAPGGRIGVVQIKSVEASIYRKKWLGGEGGMPEAPLWIALQASLEAHLTGADFAIVAPLVVGHGLDMPEIEIPLVDGVVGAMKDKVADFWNMIAENREPVADYTRDGGVIERIYERADPDAEEIDLASDNRIQELVSDRAAYHAHRKAMDEQLEAIDAEIKAKLGNATIGRLPDGRKITWKQQDRKAYTVEAKSFRVLRYPTQRESETQSQG